MTYAQRNIENVKLVLTSVHNDIPTIIAKVGEVHIVNILLQISCSFMASTYQPLLNLLYKLVALTTTMGIEDIQLMIGTVRHLSIGLKNMVCMLFSMLKAKTL